MSERITVVQEPTAVQTRQAVLTIICLAGEMPLGVQYLLPGGDKPTARQRAIYRLTESGIAKIVGKGEDRSIRLYAKTKGTGDLPKAFEYVEELLGPASTRHYFAATHGHQMCNNPDKKARRLRMAEVFVMMMRAGIETRPWMMPRIDIDNQPLMSGVGFYHSRVLKTAPGEPPEKISYARICGLLMSPGGSYAVFNIHHGLIRGATASEKKTLAMLYDVLMRSWEPPQDLKQEGWYIVTQAIAIGSGIDAAVTMYFNDKRKKTEYLQLGATYPDVYFVPLDESGFFMLWMFAQRQWRERILKGLVKSDFISNGGDRTYDAVTGDGYDILLWFDANMSKLQFFGQEDRDDGMVNVKHCLFLCFEWQVPLLQQCLGENVNVKTYSLHKIQSILTKP